MLYRVTFASVGSNVGVVQVRFSNSFFSQFFPPKYMAPNSPGSYFISINSFMAMFSVRPSAIIIHYHCHGWIQKVLPEGSNSDVFFFLLLFFYVGRGSKIALKADNNRHASKRHLNGVSKWADDGPKFNAEYFAASRGDADLLSNIEYGTR